MNKKNIYTIPAMLAIATVVPFTPAVAQVQDVDSNISVVDQEVDQQAALQWEDRKTANPGDTVTFKRLTNATGLTTFPVSSSKGDISVRFDAFGNAIVTVPKTTKVSQFTTTFQYEVNGERHSQKLVLDINQPEPEPVTITPSGIDQELMLQPGESRTITPRKSLPPGVNWEFIGGKKTTTIGNLFTATINADNTITIKATDTFPDGAKNELTGKFSAVANAPGYARSTDLFKVTIYRDPANAKNLEYPGEEKEIEIEPGKSVTLSPTETFGPGAKLTLPESLGGGWSVKDAGKGDGTIIVTAPSDVEGMKSVEFGVIVKDPNNQNLESQTYLTFISEHPDYGQEKEKDTNKYEVKYDTTEKDVRPGGSVTFKNVGSKLPEGSSLSFMVPQGWDIQEGDNGDIIVTSRSDKHIDGAWSTFNTVVTYPDGTNEIAPVEGMLKVNVKGEKVPGAELVDVSQTGTDDASDEITNPSDNEGEGATNDSNNDGSGDNTGKNGDSADLTEVLPVPGGNSGSSNSDSSDDSTDNDGDHNGDRSSSHDNEEEDKYYDRPESRSDKGSSSDKNDDDKKNSSSSESSNGGGAKVISSNGSGSNTGNKDNLGGYGENDGGMGNTITSSSGNYLAPAANASAEGAYGPKVDTGGAVDNIWTKIANIFK